MRLRRILVVLPSFEVGGAQHYARRLIQYGVSQNIEWHVTGSTSFGRALEAHYVELEASVHDVSPGYGSPLRIARFLRFLCRHEFHAVMSLNGIFAGLALTLARFAGVPTRVAWHRRSTPAYAPSPIRALYANASHRLLVSSSTHILSNSAAALDRFHPTVWRASPKYQVIPNGVDSARFSPNPTARARLRRELEVSEDTLVIGHVGRVDPAKDHETLFATVRLIRQGRCDVRLVLVGPGTDDPHLHARVTEHGIEDITVTMGPRDDVQDWYNAFDIFAFPSVTEGQPNALIEAMLSGVRVVATNIPGIRETVPSSQEAYLVAPRDPSALARVIERRSIEPASVTDQVRQWAVERYDLDRNLSLALQPLLGEAIHSKHA